MIRNTRIGGLLSIACILGLSGGIGRGNLVAEDTTAKRRVESGISSRTLIGLQYESFFTPHNVNWTPPVGPSGSIGLYNGSAEAIPVLGKYSSYDVKIIRKHEEWFEYLGIDWLLLDWTNFLIAKTPWEEHRDATGEAEQTTELIFKTYHQLELEGKHPPKLV